MSKRSGASLAKRLGEARRLHNRGDLAPALRAYGDLFKEAPENPEVLHLFGVALAQAGRLAEGERHLLRALDLAPRNADILFDVGALRDAQGRPGEALTMIQRVVEVAPDRADAWSAIGLYQRDLANLPAASAAFARAYRLSPDRIDLALQAGELMTPDDGAEFLVECLTAHPGEESLLLPLAELLMRGGRMEEAEATLQTLRTRRPNSALLSRHLGAVYLRQQRLPEAAAALYESIRIDAADAETWSLLSNVRNSLGDGDGSVAAIERAISLRPNDLLLIGIRSRLQQHAARVELEMEELAALPMAVRSTANIRMIEGMLLPPILDSAEQIVTLRERWMNTMSDVQARPTFIPEPWEMIGLSGYFLGYHGMVDRPLMEALARATLAMSPHLNYTSPNLTRSRGEKIKIGFLSAYMRNHSVGRVLIHLMGNLDRERFEVILFQIPNPKGQGDEMAEAAADRTVRLVTQLEMCRTAIEAEQLDVLLFCDLHMSVFGEALSHSRMAPVQATTWGHPGTGGRTTIDYWLSCEDWEPEGNERFYTEKLVRFKNPPYVSKESPATDKSIKRSDLGLREDARLYGCLQSLFKFHPDFDEYLGDILTADPKARIVLTSGEHFRWTERLRKRFHKTFDPSRIDFLPKLSFSNYLAALALCDVHLDPIHFGGANTSFDALSRGRPIVTLPGDQMRGRVTLGAYRQMGYPDMIVNSRKEFVEKSLRVAQDPRLGREAEKAILSTKKVLFDNLAPVAEFEAWLEEVVKG
jgi:protein O-GlcNAc transferase